MAEFAKDSASVGIQTPQGQVPFYQEDVGGYLHQAANQVFDGVKAYADFQKDKQTNAGLRFSSDMNIGYNGELQAIAKDPTKQNAEAYQAAVVALHNKYTSGEFADSVEKQLGAHGAKAFVGAFYPMLTTATMNAIDHSVKADQAQTVARDFVGADQARRDAVAAPFGSVEAAQHMKINDDMYDNMSPLRVPDRAQRKVQSHDDYLLAATLKESRRDPKAMIARFDSGDTKFKYGDRELDLAAMPEHAKAVKAEAYATIRYQQEQQSHEMQKAIATNKAIEKTLVDKNTFDLLSPDPAVAQAAYQDMRRAASEGLLSGDTQWEFHNRQLALNNMKNKGPEHSDPEDWGKLQTAIEHRAADETMDIMHFPGSISTNDRKSFAASNQVLVEREKHENAALARERRKTAESWMRGILKAKDPTTGFGDIDPKAEHYIAEFRDLSDRAMQSVEDEGSGKWKGINFVKFATQVIDKNQEAIGHDFKLKASKTIYHLGKFVPPAGQEISYKKIHENVDNVREYPDLTPNQRLMYHSILHTMESQGITREKIDSTLHGADLQDETKQASWLSRMLTNLGVAVAP